MRTIKFRGKTTTGAIWKYGYYYAYDTQFGLKHFIREVEEDPGIRSIHDYEIDPETLGQYTGLQDVEGVDIYEGDTVQTPFVDPIFGDTVGEVEGGPISKVGFNMGDFVVEYDDRKIYLSEFVAKSKVKIINPDIQEPKTV